MIKICNLQIKYEETHCFVCCKIVDDIKNIDEELYFTTTIAYRDYVVFEKADIFVITMLMPAILSGSDIYIDAPISEELNYSLNNGLIYILCKTFKLKEIKVTANSIIETKYNGQAVGAGCSMGVDSFATIEQNLMRNNKWGNKITHLAIFNTCEFGFEDFNESCDKFMNECYRAQKFADELSIPLVKIESNAILILSKYNVGLFQSCTLLHSAAILFLEKLFKTYLHASGYLLDKLCYTNKSTEYYEPIIFDLLSTKNIKIISTLVSLERTERTRLITENTFAQKYLHVCWRINLIDNKHNCGKCPKCVRTILTLDILNRLNQFESIFDLSYYKRHKNKILAEVIGFKSINYFHRDIFDLIKREKYPIPYKAKILSIKYYSLVVPYYIYQHLPKSIYTSLKKALIKTNYFGLFKKD